MEIEIKNMTSHDITVVIGEAVQTFPPSGTVVRVSSLEEIVGEVNGIPVKKIIYGEVENLPEKEDDVVLVVSLPVLLRLKEEGKRRYDLVAPNTSPSGAVRDKEGRIIGVRSFQVV
jgi:hypothetical protein